MDRPVRFYTGGSRKCQRWEAAEMPWPELAARLCSFARTSETMEEWAAMSRDQRGEIKDVGGFCAAELAGGRRKSEFVASRTMVTLDLDYADSIERAELAVSAALTGVAWAMYTTHSHTPQQARLRLVVPLAMPVKPAAYEPVARMVAKQVGIEWMDTTTYEIARMFYWPSCSKDAEPWSKWRDGEGLDPYEMLRAYKGRHLEPSAWPRAQRELAQQGRGAASAQRALDFAGGAAAAPSAGGGQLEDPLAKGGLVGDFCRAYYPIEEAIELLLPDVYSPAPSMGRGRYTYAYGTTSGGAIAYEHRYLKSHHDSDPANGMRNIFDLVRVHRYGHLDHGGESGAEAPSYKAMVEWIRSDRETQRRLGEARRQGIERDFGQVDLSGEKFPGKSLAMPGKSANFTAEKHENIEFVGIEEAPKAPKKGKARQLAEDVGEDWLNQAIADGSFKAGKQTIQNAYCVLTRDPRLKGRLVHDDFTGRDSVEGDLPWRPVEPGDDAWTDRDEACLRAYLERYGLTAKGQIADAVEQALTRRSRHPVREYLDRLRWDGKPRLERLFIDYLGAEDTPYNRLATRMHFAAAVARVREPGVKYDYCLVLQGPQGTGKSTSLQIMFGDWFSDSATTTEGKEGMEALRGKWGIEYGELSALTRSEVEQVKAFLTSRSDTYRPAYARHSVTLPRQCVFFATTNQDKFLRGDTGNRRFLTITIDPALRKWPERPEGTTPAYLDALRGVRDQLWAEASAIWAAGCDLRLPADLEGQSRERQEELNVDSDDPLAPMLAAFLDEELPLGWESTPLPKRRAFWRDPEEMKSFTARAPRDRFCAAEFICERLGKEPGDREYTALVRRVNRMMAKLPGWKTMTATNHVAKLYGRQRGFRREVHPINIDDADL